MRVLLRAPVIRFIYILIWMSAAAKLCAVTLAIECLYRSRYIVVNIEVVIKEIVYVTIWMISNVSLCMYAMTYLLMDHSCRKA
jgi:hypothetical protein